jgi:AcrR family transcriptional regulator
MKRTNLKEEKAMEAKSGAQAESPGNATMASREKLLAAALHLFAARGVDRVSVRDIAHEAGVNSALVGYYFRSKDGLLSQLYRRHCEPLNAERMRLMGSFSRGGAEPSLEKVLEAFIRPALAITTDSSGLSEFTRLRALLAAENTVALEALVAANFDHSTTIFVNALERCLPHLSHDDVLWRFHFMLGTINYTVTGPSRIALFSEGRCDPLRVEDTLQELIPFLAAGFRAPAPKARIE